MKTAVSADGTALAFDRFGEGPPVIMVAGAFNTRSATEPLAKALAQRFAVLNYDRRGRGDSGDTAPYAVEREAEDIGALITAAGGSAAVFGYSSGAGVALRAASELAVAALVLYEPPYVASPAHPGPPADIADRLSELVATGRRGEAVELFQSKVIGMPDEIIAQLREAPFRPGMEAIAHTLVYDVKAMGDYAVPAQMLAQVSIPALVIAGGQSPPPLRAAAAAVADALPNGRCVTLAGEGHDISPQATAPVVAKFLSG